MCFHNNVLLEGYPFVETTWLRTSAEKMMNCRLEEVTLQSECPNCTISSPLGDVPGSARGSFQHNLVTLVWDDTWKETKAYQIRIIERGTGVRYSGNNSTTFRVRDPLKQLDSYTVQKTYPSVHWPKSLPLSELWKGWTR
jgi:hypothetical protein